MEHSLGPWRRASDALSPGKTEGVSRDEFVIRDATGFEVCTGWHFMCDQFNANANLIAAAPTLLEACEAALLRDDIDDGSELGELLRSAVAAAKGGAA